MREQAVPEQEPEREKQGRCPPPPPALQMSREDLPHREAE